MPGWKSWTPGALVSGLSMNTPCSPASTPPPRFTLAQELTANRGYRWVMLLGPLVHVLASWAVLQCAHRRVGERTAKENTEGREESLTSE